MYDLYGLDLSLIRENLVIPASCVPQSPSSAANKLGATAVREGQVQGAAREHQGLLAREGLPGQQGATAGR